MSNISKTELLSAPASLIVNSEEELMQKLEEARQDIDVGRVDDAFACMERIRKRYVQISRNR